MEPNREDDVLNFRGSIRSWQLLAAAILRSGYTDNDERFLNSEWAQELMYFATGSGLYNTTTPRSRLRD